MKFLPLLTIMPYSSNKKLIFVSNLLSPPSPIMTRTLPPPSTNFLMTSNWNKKDKYLLIMWPKNYGFFFGSERDLSLISQVNFCLCVRTPRYLVFTAETASAKMLRLHCKQRMVIISTEFGSKQHNHVFRFGVFSFDSAQCHRAAQEQKLGLSTKIPLTHILPIFAYRILVLSIVQIRNFQILYVNIVSQFLDTKLNFTEKMSSQKMNNTSII